jgi:hypothetical protein
LLASIHSSSFPKNSSISWGPADRRRSQLPGVTPRHPVGDGLVITTSQLAGVPEAPGQIERFEYLHDLLGMARNLGREDAPVRLIQGGRLGGGIDQLDTRSHRP